MNERLISQASAEQVYSSIFDAYDVPYQSTVNEFVYVVARLIHRHLYRSHHVYIAALQCSLPDLNTVMRMFTGLTFREFRDQYIMLAAYELLRETTLDMGEIAQRLGFSSNVIFYQFFMRYSDTPPREWRLYQRRKDERVKTPTEIKTEQQRKLLNQ